MTAKDLRYALNAKLAGLRGPGVLVSEKTVKRWAKRWVVAGLVEESSVRQKGSKGGRPQKGFSIKMPIYEPKNVQNLPSFFEDPSVGGTLSFGQGSDKSVQNPEMSKTLEDEVTQEGTVAAETRENDPAGENLGKSAPQSGSEVLDISDRSEGVSETSKAETLSSTVIPENEPEVLDNSSGIKGDPPFTEYYEDWDSECWGA